jgi:hypothetical protein
VSLQYRFIAQDSRGELVAKATKAFSTWLVEKKGIHDDLDAIGRRKVSAHSELGISRAGTTDLSVVRYSLYEETQSGRWATILTVVVGDDQGWLWLDLEWVSEDPWGREPTVKPPALVRYLLIDQSVHIGPIILQPAHVIVETSEQSDRLAKVLLDPTRQSPIVILSFDGHAALEDRENRARLLARELMGLAPVYSLSEKATDQFNRRVGPDLKVYGGAVRTYMPGPAGSAPPIFRHRVLGAKRFESNMQDAIQLVSAPLRARALSARPPAIYREQGRALLQGDGTSADIESLLADTIAAEELAERSDVLATSLRDELEWQALEHDETLSDFQSAGARIRFLEQELTKVNVHLAGVETPESFADTDIKRFDEIEMHVASSLPLIELGDIEDGVDALDQFPQAPAWAKKSWRALVALQNYAEAKKRGWTGDFNTWCLEPEETWSRTVPSKWVALTESDTVDNNPRFKSARVFPVPTTVDPTGEVYMCAHIKIVEGGRPAPRIHFFDDTSGSSGKIWIGYIGPHLLNGQTN